MFIYLVTPIMQYLVLAVFGIGSILNSNPPRPIPVSATKLTVKRCQSLKMNK